MVILTIIIFAITMCSSKVTNLVKYINTGLFLFIIFMSLLSSNIVVTKSNNIRSDVSVYGNDYLTAMVQITTNTFVIWMIVLLVIKIIYSIHKRIDENSEINNKIIPIKEIDIPSNVTLKQQEIKEEHKEEMFTLEEYKLLYEYLKEIKSKGQNK